MPLKHNSHSQYSQFEHALAQYRAKVYESYFLEARKQGMTLGEVITAQPRQPTILIIDDKADEWFILRWGLGKQYPGAILIWLAQAEEVLPYLDRCRQTETDLPQLILLDLYLPSFKSGLAVLQALKAHHPCQHIPVVVTSRSADPDDVTTVFTYSASSYIVKPDNPVEWLASLATLEIYLNREKASGISINRPKK